MRCTEVNSTAALESRSVQRTAVLTVALVDWFGFKSNSGLQKPSNKNKLLILHTNAKGLHIDIVGTAEDYNPFLLVPCIRRACLDINRITSIFYHVELTT